MDAHLLTKIIHMTAVAAALMVFVLRASTLFIGVQGEQPNPAGRKVLVALQHLSFTVVFITGAILLVMKDFQVQPWFYAKIILFLVLLIRKPTPPLVHVPMDGPANFANCLPRVCLQFSL